MAHHQALEAMAHHQASELRVLDDVLAPSGDDHPDAEV